MKLYCVCYPAHILNMYDVIYDVDSIWDSETAAKKRADEITKNLSKDFECRKAEVLTYKLNTKGK